MELAELSKRLRQIVLWTPGIVPACCQIIQMNEHDQLPVHVVDKTHTVDSVHLLC